MPDRRQRLAHLARGSRVERVVLGLDRTAGPGVRPARVALGDEPLHPDGAPSGQQVIGALGPQPVGHREAAIEVAHVERLDRCQLVDDHIGLRLGDGARDLVGIECVNHHRLRPQLPQRPLLGLAPRGADDPMAGVDQSRHQLLAHRSCRSGNENFHAQAPHNRLHQL